MYGHDIHENLYLNYKIQDTWDMGLGPLGEPT